MTMRVSFWGTRGSLPVAQRPDAIRRKIARALLIADGRRFADEAAAAAFAATELDHATAGTYGGATACVEIDGGDDGSFMVCDMGSGLREFGIDAARRSRAGRPKVYNIFLSHLHWDHIMGFPFFAAAFDPEATIRIHGGHPDLETALRRQQEEISFPVPFEALPARIEFVTLATGCTHTVGGCDVRLIRQDHSHLSYGYRFERQGRSVIFSTDAEHRIDDAADARAFAGFFEGADLVICDTMYSFAESITLKADWGHSSNIVAVDLCHAAAAKRLVLFHHEPTYADEDIARLHQETIRYEELSRGGGGPLEVLCAYDGLEISV